MLEVNMEEWKDIIGYEGLYEVSTYGRVRSKGKIINPWIQHGYKSVGLWKNKKCKKHRVHRLVAMAFIPNPNNYPQINHKDEDKSNNNVKNLEWCTQSYNNSYGNRCKKMLQTYNQNKTSNAEKEVVQKLLDGTIIAVYKSLSEASRITGLSIWNLSSVCNKKPHRRTLGGYKWDFRKTTEK